MKNGMSRNTARFYRDINNFTSQPSLYGIKELEEKKTMLRKNKSRVVTIKIKRRG